MNEIILWETQIWRIRRSIEYIMWKLSLMDENGALSCKELWEEVEEGDDDMENEIAILQYKSVLWWKWRDLL